MPILSDSRILLLYLLKFSWQNLHLLKTILLFYQYTVFKRKNYFYRQKKSSIFI